MPVTSDVVGDSLPQAGHGFGEDRYRTCQTQRMLALAPQAIASGLHPECFDNAQSWRDAGTYC